MNILLDTNILIPLEDTARLLQPKYAELRQLAAKLGHSLYIHPLQYQDIKRDENKTRQELMLSRIAQYQKIPSPPMLTENDLVEYGWRQTNQNDYVDNSLLHSLFRGAIHILVTNDEAMHRKARSTKFRESIHRVDQFLSFLKAQDAEQSLTPPGLTRHFLYEFDVKQPFFDSLRAAYDGFNEWYIEKAKDHREAWCVQSNGILSAICIFKEETDQVITDAGEALIGKSLKLCTFKVSQELYGQKIGERLFFTAFTHAALNNYRWIYLHVLKDAHFELEQLCSEFGFTLYGAYKGDAVYVKSHNPPISANEIEPLEYAIAYHPFYRMDEDIQKFIVPINPLYHEELFPDISHRAEGLFRNDINIYPSQSNTIKKAYICHSSIKSIRQGDILLFYRTEDRKSIECLGIVEYCEHSDNFDNVYSLISKRTVFGENKLRTMLSRNALILLFRYMRHFEPVSYQTLKQSGILGPYQTIRKITHQQFLSCFARN